MAEFRKTRGSMKEVLPLEVNVDTVYVRKNIVAINEEDFQGWEYEEKQYTLNDYIKHIGAENEEAKNTIADLAELVLMGGM